METSRDGVLRVREISDALIAIGFDLDTSDDPILAAAFLKANAAVGLGTLTPLDVRTLQEAADYHFNRAIVYAHQILKDNGD